MSEIQTLYSDYRHCLKSKLYIRITDTVWNPNHAVIGSSEFRQFGFQTFTVQEKTMLLTAVWCLAAKLKLFVKCVTEWTNCCDNEIKSYTKLPLLVKTMLHILTHKIFRLFLHCLALNSNTWFWFFYWLWNSFFVNIYVGTGITQQLFFQNKVQQILLIKSYHTNNQNNSYQRRLLWSFRNAKIRD